MAYKYKTSHRASLYVPGEDIPKRKQKKDYGELSIFEEAVNTIFGIIFVLTLLILSF